MDEELLATGQYDVILRALASVPSAQIKRHPLALFLQGRILEIQGNWREAEVIYRRTLRRAPPVRLRAKIKAELANFLLRRGEHERCLASCRRTIREGGTRQAGVHGRLLALMGIALSELGRLDEGEKYLRQTITLFRRRGDAPGEARALY